MVAYGPPYTDRDVRESEKLRELALLYAANYDGTFQPLITAREYLRETGRMSTKTARIVLNCMRHDDGVSKDMPKPKGFTRRKHEPKVKKWQCSNKEPHYGHWSDKKGRCEGVPWPINRRSTVDVAATVKYPFAVSQSGAFVHRTHGSARVRWYPNRHDWGFSEHVKPILYVRLICKYPSVLRNPILVTKEPDYTQMENAIRPLTRCMRGCFE